MSTLITLPAFAEGSATALSSIRYAFQRAERIKCVETMRQAIAESHPDAAAGRFVEIIDYPVSRVVLDAILDKFGNVISDDIEFDDEHYFAFSDRDVADLMLDPQDSRNGVASYWVLAVDADTDDSIEEAMPDASVLSGVLPDVFAKELLLALVNRFIVA